MPPSWLFRCHRTVTRSPRRHTADGVLGVFRTRALPVFQSAGQGPGQFGGLHSTGLYGAGCFKLKCAATRVDSNTMSSETMKREKFIIEIVDWMQ